MFRLQDNYTAKEAHSLGLTKDDFLSWERTTRDTIDFKKIYVDMAGGDLVAGLLLSQIVYWHLPGEHGSKLRVRHGGHKWIAKADDDWYDEIRITGRQARRAAKILVKLGLVVKEVHRFNGTPTCHYRLVDGFMDAWNVQIAIINAQHESHGDNL
jgi:hypothetical protein